MTRTTRMERAATRYYNIYITVTRKRRRCGTGSGAPRERRAPGGPGAVIGAVIAVIGAVSAVIGAVSAVIGA